MTVGELIDRHREEAAKAELAMQKASELFRLHTDTAEALEKFIAFIAALPASDWKRSDPGTGSQMGC